MRRAGILTGNMVALMPPRRGVYPASSFPPPGTHDSVDHDRLWFDMFPSHEKHQPSLQQNHRIELLM